MSNKPFRVEWHMDVSAEDFETAARQAWVRLQHRCFFRLPTLLLVTDEVDEEQRVVEMNKEPVE